MISGHGNFKWNLKKLGLTETETCTCGEMTVEHVIFECRLITETRKKLEQAIRNFNLPWLCDYRELVSERVYNIYSFATKTLRSRENNGLNS